MQTEADLSDGELHLIKGTRHLPSGYVILPKATCRRPLTASTSRRAVPFQNFVGLTGIAAERVCLRILESDGKKACRMSLAITPYCC